MNAMKGLLLAALVTACSWAQADVMVFRVKDEPRVTIRLMQGSGQYCLGETQAGQVIIGKQTYDMCWLIVVESARLLVFYNDGIRRAFDVEDLEQVAKMKAKPLKDETGNCPRAVAMMGAALPHLENYTPPERAELFKLRDQLFEMCPQARHALQ